MGVDEEIFYDVSRVAIVPMGFCFPGLDAKGGDLPPRKECVRTWHDRVFATMQRPGLDGANGDLPALILIIGQYAQAYHLGRARRSSLTETVRAWRDYYEAENDGLRLVLPHPSWRNTGWLKKNPWFEAEILPVLRQEIAKRL